MGTGFRRFWAASTISASGTALTTVVIPIIAVQQLAATPVQMGVLFAAATAASFVLRLPAAAWADRSGSTFGVVSRMQLLSGALVVLVPLLWAFSALSYVSLLVIVAAQAAAGAISEAFAAPALLLLVPRSERAGAYGRFSSSRAAADIASPSLGGVLLQVVAAPLLLVLDALSFLVASLLTRSIRVPTRETPEPAPAAEARGHDLWAIFREPFLRRCLLVIAYASLANGAASALLVLFMIEQLRMEPAAVGVVLGSGAAGGLLAGMLIGRIQRRLGVGGTAAIAGFLLVASLAGLPFAQPGWTGLAACLFYELAGSFGAVLMVITVVSEIPDRLASGAIARGMAIANLVPEIAATLGALAGGALASGTSVRFTLWSAALLAVAAGLLTLAVARVPVGRGVQRSGP